MTDNQTSGATRPSRQYRMATTKRLWSPLALLWIAVLLVVLYLTCAPLLQNVWAYYTWDRVPCAVRERGDYLYVIAAQRYTATRKNFWEHKQTTAQKALALTDLPPLDATCYVKPGSPEVAVLNLDAQNHLADGALGFANAGLALTVAAVITVVVRRKSRTSRG